ncbi:LPS export ABC transporter periplasmic protein LptC [Daejeonella sp. H1SJ63]|uniref:LPS export ABC transporter periplasmic protein LptC n=1 Tax=Daejeonella sp. H1SJ63 TaxID=3034145 RepID=UPI0023ECEC8D|nr:LPS export ABC transporter periplasmic protein LptC [Daejeonella sp. H1SJ63]
MKMLRCISCIPAGRFGALMLIGTILFSACENDLKKVEQISAKKLIVPVDKSTGVEIIYSDSAKVRAKLITPELLNFKTEKPYIEMKKGITVIFYDENQQETSRLRADYAIRRERENIVELKRNVVASNTKGETFRSDELYWDENKRRFYSNKLVSITSSDNVLYGTSFWANEDFSYYEIVQSTGDLRLRGEEGF